MTDLAPSSVPVQQESLQYNQPVSEASASAIGAICNYLLRLQNPVGSFQASILEETQFITQLNFPSPSTWVLADGRSVLGSTYQTLTGNTNIPDLRGITIRGLNNGGSAAGTRSDGNQNPNDPSGTFVPGKYSEDTFQGHVHGEQIPTTVGSFDSVQSAFGNASSSVGIPNGNPFTGPPINDGVNGVTRYGLDTAPKNVSLNWYVRIN